MVKGFLRLFSKKKYAIQANKTTGTIIDVNLQNIPEEIQDLVYKLNNNGFQLIYLTGLCVCDLLVNIKPQYYEIAVDAEAKDIIHTIPNAIITGQGIYSIRVSFIEFSVQFLTLGRNSKVHLSSNSIKKYFSTLKFIGRQRHFSCKGLYYNILSGKIIDYTGGYIHINNKELLTNAAYETCFTTAPLSILKAVRYELRYGFKLPPVVKRYIAQSAGPELKVIGKTKIFDESCQMLCSNHGLDIFNCWWEYKFIHNLFPRLGEELLKNYRLLLFVQATLKYIATFHEHQNKMRVVFGFSALMWPVFIAELHSQKRIKRPNHVLHRVAFDNTIVFMGLATGLPNNLREQIFEVYAFQFQLQNPIVSRLDKMLLHKSFKIALEFFFLRYQSYKVPNEMVLWWRKFTTAKSLPIREVLENEIKMGTPSKHVL